MKVYFSTGAMLLALQLLGCNVDVQQTENGVTIAIECGESPSDDQPSDEEPGIDDPATDDPSTDDGTESPLPSDG